MLRLLSWCNYILTSQIWQHFWSSRLGSKKKAPFPKCPTSPWKYHTVPFLVVLSEHHTYLTWMSSNVQHCNCSEEVIWRPIGLWAASGPLLFQYVCAVSSPGNSLHSVLTPNHVTGIQWHLLFMVNTEQGLCSTEAGHRRQGIFSERYLAVSRHQISNGILSALCVRCLARARIKLQVRNQLCDEALLFAAPEMAGEWAWWQKKRHSPSSEWCNDVQSSVTGLANDLPSSVEITFSDRDRELLCLM